VIDRRTFLAATGAVLLAAPLAASAQPTGKIWRIGLFHVGLDHVPPQLDGLREGLRALGYEDGVNIRLDWRNLPNETAARDTAKEFVRDRVNVIVAFESQTARAAKAATSDIPIVFVSVGAAVGDELVKTLARPGGNVTGFTGFTELFGKQLELFKELVPRLRRVLVLIDTDDPMTRTIASELRAAGAKLEVALVERQVRDRADIERAFGALKPGDVNGVFVGSLNLQATFTSLVMRLAAEKRLPLRAHRREWVEQGALFSYAPNYHALGRAAAQYVDKILKGAKPADLPVEQPTKFELVINLKAAKTLGLTIPQSLLQRADQVIE